MKPFVYDAQKKHWRLSYAIFFSDCEITVQLRVTPQLAKDSLLLLTLFVERITHKALTFHGKHASIRYGYHQG